MAKKWKSATKKKIGKVAKEIAKKPEAKKAAAAFNSGRASTKQAIGKVEKAGAEKKKTLKQKVKRVVDSTLHAASTATTLVATAAGAVTEVVHHAMPTPTEKKPK